MDEKEELFGVPIEKYIHPEEKDASETSHEFSASSAVAKIEHTLSSISKLIHNILLKISEKLLSHNITIKNAKKIDIEALNLTNDVNTLRSLYKAREENERSILRLKIGETCTLFNDRLRRIENITEELTKWMHALETQSKRVEEDLLKRNTIYEIRAGHRLAEKHKETTEKLSHLESLFHSVQSFIRNHSALHSKEEQEENTFSESFIRLSSEEDRVITHLLSLFENRT